MESGVLTIEEIVFKPAHLVHLLETSSLPARYAPGISLTANGQAEIASLLLAVFSDWIDFVFIPVPKSFAIYADHDEFTTFLAHRRSNLNRVAEALTKNGFAIVSNYKRRF